MILVHHSPSPFLFNSSLVIPTCLPLSHLSPLSLLFLFYFYLVPESLYSSSPSLGYLIMHGLSLSSFFFFILKAHITYSLLLIHSLNLVFVYSSLFISVQSFDSLVEQMFSFNFTNSVFILFAKLQWKNVSTLVLCSRALLNFTADSCQNTGHLMTYWNNFQWQKKGWGADSEPWWCCGMMESGGFALFIMEISFSWSMFSLPHKQVWNMASWVLLWIPSPPRCFILQLIYIFLFFIENFCIDLHEWDRPVYLYFISLKKP